MHIYLLSKEIISASLNVIGRTATALSFMMLSSLAFSVENDPVIPVTNPVIPPELQAKIQAYQQCITGVMSTLDPAAVKRQKLLENCELTKMDYVNEFHEKVQLMVATNIDRHLELVLDTLEAAEGKPFTLAEDVLELIEEHKTLANQE